MTIKKFLSRNIGEFGRNWDDIFKKLKGKKNANQEIKNILPRETFLQKCGRNKNFPMDVKAKVHYH
jgi:hypothetical protein